MTFPHGGIAMFPPCSVSNYAVFRRHLPSGMTFLWFSTRGFLYSCAWLRTTPWSSQGGWQDEAARTTNLAELHVAIMWSAKRSDWPWETNSFGESKACSMKTHLIYGSVLWYMSWGWRCRSIWRGFVRFFCVRGCTNRHEATTGWCCKTQVSVLRTSSRLEFWSWKCHISFNRPDKK